MPSVAAVLVDELAPPRATDGGGGEVEEEESPTPWRFSAMPLPPEGGGDEEERD